MNTTVIICTANRPVILHETVLGLSRQTVQPNSIILSLCDESSVLAETRSLPLVRCVFGPQGLSIQRNTAIPLARTAYTLFLDDDVELGGDYIEEMERVFAEDPSIAAASGRIVADGAKGGKGIEREAAIEAVLENSGNRGCSAIKIKEFYGCNMFVRTDILRTEKFDERLPLYGWLEDRDFLWRCAKHGKMVRNQGALIAHLATRSGRTSGVRYGYLKIANPWHLWRKSVISSLPELVAMYWMKTTFANLIRAIMPKQPQSVDYKKRLKGNLMAYRDLLLFRIDPRNILNIADSTEMSEEEERDETWRSAPSRSTSLNGYSGKS
jgi:glycosyltransferase involved in cell wall biosynthesis